MLDIFKKNIRWFTAIIIILVISAAVYIYLPGELWRFKPGKEYTIALTDDGFLAQEITIEQGDSVKFITTRGKEFWPTSNLHPSHAIYPEFDPHGPILPDGSWSFRFDRIGEWHYHDHVRSYFTGTIYVE